MSRPGLRSQDGAPFLSLPLRGAGRGSRSPSPNRPGNEDEFFPAQENMSTINIEDVRRIAAAAAEAAASAATATAVREAAAAAADAALAAIQRPATSCPSRKPELPTFDKANVEVWLKRIEGAFARASITTPKDKFFFLEPKFDVNLNPKINEFLFGEATEETWNNFTEYLKEEYGHTKEQQASAFLNGIKRDGRRPTQHLAYINDRINKISLDDLKKETILRDLPQDVRRALSDKVDSMTAEETAKAADAYFDKDGKQRFSSAPTISEVRPTEDHNDDHEGIHAVGSRFRQSGQRYEKKPFVSKPKNFTQSGKPNAPPAKNANATDPSLCWYHNEFGSKAQKCEVGCAYKPKTGNANAGRRA